MPVFLRKISAQEILSATGNNIKRYCNMLVSNSNESTENRFDFKQPQAGVESNNVLILQDITRELQAYLARESGDEDSIDGIFNILTSISDSVQVEFDKLISIDSDKKRLLRVLSRIFTLLLNTKVNMAEKILKILKIAIETTLKIWQEPKPQ